MLLAALYFILCLLNSHVSASWSVELTAEDNTLTSKLLGRLEELDLYVKQQDSRIKELESTVTGQQRQILELKTKKSNPGNKQTLIRGNEEDHKISRALRPTAPRHVAFSAYLDHRVTGVGIDQTIPFNKVVINDGNAFKTTTGIFTCPVSGVYLFSYMVNTYFSAYQLVVKLVVDGVNYSDGISDPFHNYQEAQGGNTVIIQVNKTQSVWLAAYNTGSTAVDGRPTHRFSTLSGVLLYKT